MLEPDVVDPIAEVRTRYLPEAVETPDQVTLVLALKERVNSKGRS
jgi:hypothetical protein